MIAWKDENKQKEAGNGQFIAKLKRGSCDFFKQSTFHSSIC